MPEKWTDREERIYQEMIDRLKFWGYQVPSGEKQMDPALLLLLKTFAFHTTHTEDRLKRAGQDVIDSLIGNFFVTGIRRPVPSFTMLSCRCTDKRAWIDTDVEFTCTLGGAFPRDYTFFPLYPQEILDVHADLVLFTSGEYFRVLKVLPPEADKWEEALDSPAYRTMKRNAPPPLGGTIWIGIQTGLPLADITALPLYLGPDADSARMLNWVDWQVVGAGVAAPFKPGEFQHQLEIFNHLDIRELELEANFHSRLYSSDFLTSGKLLWHFKHYLAPAKNFALVPGSALHDAPRSSIPDPIKTKFAHLDFSKLPTPRLWLKIELARDEKVGDLRRFVHFDTNTLLLVNRRRAHLNKYTMGQPALEVNLFEYQDEDMTKKLFSIDRVWDSRDQEYANHLDLTSFANPFKYNIIEEEGAVKVALDFEGTGKEPPDFVVVQYSLTEGADGNGIGADTNLKLARDHPQLHTPRNLISSSGGSDAKTDEEVRRMTGFFLRNHGVALSEGEIEYLARSFDSRIGTAKANRGVTRSPGGLVPSVIVDISLKSDAKITQEERKYLLQRLEQYLDSYTPLNLHLSARLVAGG